MTGSVPRVLCLLQAWAAALQQFVKMLGGLGIQHFQILSVIADELGGAATYLCGAHELGDLTALQRVDLPENFRSQVREDQALLEKELGPLPCAVARHLVELPSRDALQLEFICDGTAAYLQDFLALCSPERPNEIALKITEAICSIRVFVVEIQGRASIGGQCTRRLTLPSAGS